ARGVRHQPRPEPLRAPVPRSGGVRARVRRPDLPRAREGLEAPARRPPVDPRLAPRVRPRAARLGLRLARTRRRRLRAAVPRAQPHRLHRAALDRVGGLGDGPRVRRARGARLRPRSRLRVLGGRVRRGDAALVTQALEATGIARGKDVEAAPDRYERMLYRRAGRSGLVLPAISLGAWLTFGGYRDASVARDCLRLAFDLGITHFDFANNYG